MLGTVESFDEVRGFGTIRTEDGRVLFFHGTTITDGSRAVSTGTRVALRVVPGHGGRWEAAEVQPL